MSSAGKSVQLPGHSAPNPEKTVGMTASATG
jgi:hypothetical protein